MDSEQTTTAARPKSRRAGAIALLAAGAVAGGILAGTLTAGAADTSSSTPSTTGSANTAPSTTQDRGRDGDGRFGGAGSVRGDEKELTGDDAAKAKAAALKAVPGGTVFRVETDAGDAAYEAHMTKADGTRVTVKLDKSFALVKVEDGMGLGDPRDADGRGSAQSEGSDA